MLALHERPTPVSMGDEDDDCATQVWEGSPLVGECAGEPARASTAGALAQDRRANSEPPARDTIVDPPGIKPQLSWWSRFRAAAGRFADAVALAFFGTEPPLTPRLPALPPPPRSSEMTLVSARPALDCEHGECVLRDILRAPPEYQHAAIEVANAALTARAHGDRAYADFMVQFALSRLRPNSDGRIAVSRLREILGYDSYDRVIVPALVRLEARGIVTLVLKASSDPMAAIQREGITHVELRVPV